jgi:hypothetical protein
MCEPQHITTLGILRPATGITFIYEIKQERRKKKEYIQGKKNKPRTTEIEEDTETTEDTKKKRKAERGKD